MGYWVGVVFGVGYFYGISFSFVKFSFSYGIIIIPLFGYKRV